nr:Dabb family protein [Nocardioides sp. zg-DK7169]
MLPHPAPTPGDNPVFQHIGVLTLTDEATEADRTAISEGLGSLLGRIDGLRSARVVFDAGIKEGNSDVLFVMTFDSRADWEAYSTHPAHVEVVKTVIGPVLASKTFLQVDAAEPAPGALV